MSARWNCASIKLSPEQFLVKCSVSNMGGSESGYLALQLDTRNIQAGLPISGTIHFHLNKAVNAQSLCLKLSGKEHIRWEEIEIRRNNESDVQPATRQVTHTYRVKGKIVRQIFPIFVFQDAKVAAGDYSFPFLVMSPASLLGSFSYEAGAMHARVVYHLSAFLLSASSKVQPSKLEVGVSSRMSQAIVRMTDSVATNVSTLMCIKKGAVMLNVHVNKNAFVPGEAIEIVVEVDNSQSALDMTRVQVALSRMIRIRLENGRNHVVKDTINQGYIIQRVRKRDTATGSNALRMVLTVQDPRGSVQNTTSLRGRHIECMYTLTVKAEMNGSCMCCGQAPTISREVTIYHVQILGGEMMQAPAGWNPTVMPVAQFAAAMEHEYNPTAPPAF